MDANLERVERVIWIYLRELSNIAYLNRQGSMGFTPVRKIIALSLRFTSMSEKDIDETTATTNEKRYRWFRRVIPLSAALRTLDVPLGWTNLLQPPISLNGDI